MTEQEVLTGEESGEGWTLTWTAWLLNDDANAWWWQIDAHRTGTPSPRVDDRRPPFFQAMDGSIERTPDTDGEFLFLDGGTLDFSAGMGTIWNGPCESRDAALAAANNFLGMGR